jgi:hypothetical protein
MCPNWSLEGPGGIKRPLPIPLNLPAAAPRPDWRGSGILMRVLSVGKGARLPEPLSPSPNLNRVRTGGGRLPRGKLRETCRG